MGAKYVLIPTAIWKDPEFTALPIADQYAWFGERITKGMRGRHGVTDAQRAYIYERDGYACLHCGTTTDLSIDHIHPRNRGGTDATENLQTLCKPCNSRKGMRV
jgi:5-methylcytosine-specific restriction endonuclease McrA